MAEIYIYLDESGSFEDQSEPEDFNPSFAGGFLCTKGQKKLIKQILDNIPEDSHACEAYDEQNFKRLQDVVDKGIKLVIFENTNKNQFVDGDVTYITVLSAGLPQIAHKLRAMYSGEELKINFHIAKRKYVNNESRGLIQPDQYEQGFYERITRYQGMRDIEYSFTYGDARHNNEKELKLADIICNTYLKRTARCFADKKKIINEIYGDSNMYKFSVHENPDELSIRNLFIESRYGEMIFQICDCRKMTKNISDLSRKLNEMIGRLDTPSIKHITQYMSAELGALVKYRKFNRAIKVAENYKKYFLEQLQCNERHSEQIRLSNFDTNFYLLTIYDHLGDVEKCKYLNEICNKSIPTVCTSLQGLEYYYSYRIRELNSLMNRYSFENVMGQSVALLSRLKDAKELLEVISGQPCTLSLLGKVHGIRLQAIINLLHTNNSLYAQGMIDSELAINEFESIDDKCRQYQYRCELQVEAGKIIEALESLAKALGIEKKEKDLKKLSTILVESIFANGFVNQFALMHYCRIMRAAIKYDMNELAETMYHVLSNKQEFMDKINERTIVEMSEYPWDMILWSYGIVARKFCATNEEIYYANACRITRTQKNIPLLVSITAERYLWRESPAVFKQLLKACNLFKCATYSEEIESVYGGVNKIIEGTCGKQILIELSDSYLR